MVVRDALCLAAFLSISNTAQLQAQDSTGAASGLTVLKGVYTNDQAKKGEDTYGKFCVSCHEAIEHAGAVFEDAWSGRPLFEFWDKIRTTMPDDEPGTLKDQQYTDIVAYMLKLSGYPAGDTELANDAEKMKSILVVARPRSDTAAVLLRRLYLPHTRQVGRSHR